ncbi:hypothetical protein RI138_01640 [Streptomyces sp. C11-1]|uniref:Thiazolylpeptide-type bacteriocin n=1 Tax=Streptomyces durocortorensis TaxID=2811104 RepID=A0ABY9VRV6_9ACTN|nr:MULTISPECIES: hypothetical protein [Streptomyces]WNF25612.1 hypothetical protein RI138_01640 [Streptomyces durocortorensis]
MQTLEEKVQVASDQNADDVFDLVIGDLEQEIPPLASPTNSGSGTACGSCASIYCC